MPDDEVQRELSELPRLVSAWQAGEMSSEGCDFQQLANLLRNHRSARSYFLQAMQIDSELRWRMASSSTVDSALAVSPEGTVRPIASIVLHELAFRNDEGFAVVYNKVEGSDSHAQLWLRLYPAIRACTLLCFPSLSQADAEVGAICEALSSRDLANSSLEEFQHACAETTLAQVSKRLRTLAPNKAGTFRSLAELCLETATELDTFSIYESIEATVPHKLPPDALRLLCMRYLVEQTPSEMASTLEVSEQKIHAQLAEARLPIWKACMRATSLQNISPQIKTLASLNRFLDALSVESDQAEANNRPLLDARQLDSLLSWLRSDTQNCKCFLTFAILHESLYRQLSLPQLLDESQSRRDKEFHEVVTDIVQQLENVPATATALTSPKTHSSTPYSTLGWIGALAAAVLVAATTALWYGGKPRNENGNSTTLTQEAPVENNRPKPEPERIAPPRPVAVGTIQIALNTPDGDAATKPGMSVYVGQSLDLADGILQISTLSGSQWVLQGPITLEMGEQGTVVLKRGKLVGLNSGQGIPLVVQTPHATVVDVGTEFGVEVGEEEATTVAVYEGAVKVAESKDIDGLPDEEVLAIEADTQVLLPSDGSFEVSAEPLVHDREFIRPDEVQLRVEQQQGSSMAAERVAFFELLRVEGLLAYQSFHADSQAEEFTIGFAEPTTRPAVAGRFGSDLAGQNTAFPSSRSLVLSNDDSVFLDLDVTAHSPLARSGLLDDSSNQVGNQPGELWLYWRSKSHLADQQKFEWVGLSLMRGDKRTKDEPLFVGQPSTFSTFGTHLYGNLDKRRELDLDQSKPGIQSQQSDNGSYCWVVGVEIQGGGNATASVWFDIDPSQVDSTPPHGQLQYNDFSCDRIRFEVSKEGAKGQCSFDQVVLTTSREALVEALAIAAKGPLNTSSEP